MTPRLSTFVYPWDLARLGVGGTLEQIAAEGFGAVYLAATYHPVDAVSPRGGLLRLFSSGRGGVYFPARRERYGRIQPSTSSPELGAVWPEATAVARSLGLGVVPWTITLYQPWIVDEHPDCARVLPGGDRIDAGVCPANDDVREYVTALCDDLVDQFDVGTLHLEGAAVPTFDYGWLRPRLLIDLPNPARELLALCFCASCQRRATSAGLDVERLRRLVNEAVAVEIGLEPASTTSDGSTAIADAELQAFAELYVRASVELIAAVGERVRGAGARLSGMPWTPFSTLLARDDELLDEMLRPFDQVIVRPSASDPRTSVAIANRTARGLELAVLVTPAELSAANATFGAPAVTTENRTTDTLRSAAEIGAAEIIVYNYGLLRDVDIQRLTKEQT
ncbi:MAG TPA: hypothetical protein VIY72_15445 [Acidimicrobiales bacterium]